MKRSTQPLKPIAAHAAALVILLAGATACGTQQQADDASPGIPVTESVHTDRAFERALIDATRDHVLHAMRAHGTPGLNLAMGYRGELIWEAGFGWADVAAAKPMTPETVYHSGSLGKTYTATAIMHLVDRGVIALDDPISQHLPFEVHNPLGDRDVTVHDLLTHRSGLSGGGAKGVWDRPVPLEEALRASYDSDASPLLGGTTPFWIGKVGAQYNYSNPGIATLGLIVQTANPDGLSFSDYVQRHIMDPLGMESSQYPPAQHVDYVRPDIWENMSTGYARMGSAWVPSVPLYFSHYPAGGVVAKPADHIRLLTAMMNGGEYEGYRVLEAETVTEMLTPQYEDPIGPAMTSGLVWRLSDYGTRRWSFDHAGGHMFGWRTEGFAWPELGVTLMVAHNQWSLPDPSPEGGMITSMVEEWIANAPPDIELMAASEEWARKVSYVRGAMYAAMFGMYVGVEGDIPADGLEEAIASTRVQPGWRDDWDPDAFREGVMDISEVGLGYAEVTGFWSSEASRVTEEEARMILQELGGRFPGTGAILFPVESADGGSR
ncbi:MAG: beta-lactamase family protein [Gemmatimonadetes bacterium]|nr:beta-lactamase family protein [Gemmatimonadota bacterium]MYG21628.1 beta-lactamase family protein [Gemmatimonadota bacterium]MYJ37864.1 beta-lactamase family protein [Gemmatimonadota bacterium]